MMTGNSSEVNNWRELLCGPHRALILVLCFGVWLHAAESLLVSTLIPDIVRDIGGASLIPSTYVLYEIGSIVTGAASALQIIKLKLSKLRIKVRG